MRCFLFTTLLLLLLAVVDGFSSTSSLKSKVATTHHSTQQLRMATADDEEDDEHDEHDAVLVEAAKKFAKCKEDGFTTECVQSVIRDLEAYQQELNSQTLKVEAIANTLSIVTSPKKKLKYLTGDVRETVRAAFRVYDMDHDTETSSGEPSSPIGVDFGMGGDNDFLP